MYTNRLVFHHIGVACDFEAFSRGAERQNLEMLGYSPEGKEWVDPHLGMRGQFMVAYNEGAPRMELIAPHGDHSPVTPWLKQGVKLYHAAFLTTDLAAEIERLRAQRAKLMFPPTAAVAFDNRRVAFLMLANSLLIELIEGDHAERDATT